VLAVAMVETVSCVGRGASKTPAHSIPASVAGDSVALYTFRVVNTFPHSTSSYTEGLQWHDGFLYEGTGLEGHSALMKIDLPTGRVLQRVELPRRYFGEGITLLGDRIYQLTWQTNEGFIYDTATFRKVGGFRFPGEGWGMTTDGQRLWMSNGTEWLYTLDPKTLQRTDSVEVRFAGRPLRLLNELEWIDGQIWANVYTTDQIVRIDPATGRVVGLIDMTGLLPQSDRTDDTDVLNGIAFDAATGRIFVTGKNWPKLFQIEVVKK